MGWNNACPACMRHRTACICDRGREDRGPMKPVAPEAHGQGVSDADFRKVQRARRDFIRRVEDAIESGDQSDLDERIGRFIDPVSR